ncbi:MAG: lipase family protein [bacterium]|nr:lipase family protein [bacterium]
MFTKSIASPFLLVAAVTAIVTLGGCAHSTPSTEPAPPAGEAASGEPAVCLEPDPARQCTSQDCQVALTMAYGANVPSSSDLDWYKKPLWARYYAFGRIQCLLDTGHAVSGKDWKITWGPAVTLKKMRPKQGTTCYKILEGAGLLPPEHPIVANTMFVAQRGSDPYYAIGIAGTNPMSFYDWCLEDFDVQPVKWEFGNPPWNADVTEGTRTGLDNLRSMKSECGDTLADYLQTLTKAPITVLVTGHSLGGALAPATALWLKDTQGLKGGWDPSSNATVEVTLFAGATPGNRVFADYMNGKFPGDSLKVVNNHLDVVPHAWPLRSLKKVKDLYSPSIKPTPVEVAFLLYLEGKVIAHPLTHYHTVGTPQQCYAFQSRIVDPKNIHAPTGKLDPFAKEALYQHVDAYPIAVGLPGLITKKLNCKKKYPAGS